jgi:hypothetical protein
VGERLGVKTKKTWELARLQFPVQVMDSTVEKIEAGSAGQWPGQSAEEQLREHMPRRSSHAFPANSIMQCGKKKEIALYL